MHIPQRQVSLSTYEASKFIKEYEKTASGRRVKAFGFLSRGSTQTSNQGITPKILNPIDDAAHKLRVNAEQTGEKTHKSTTRDTAIKSSNMPFSREEIKEIFRYHDNNKDGTLNRKELTKAFASLGSMFPFYRACYAMIYADTNEDGLISEAELDKLVDYACKVIKKK